MNAIFLPKLALGAKVILLSHPSHRQEWDVIWSLWLFLVLNFSKGSCQMNKFLLRIPITSIQQKALIWAHLKPADMILWINFQIPGHFKNTGRIEPLKQGKRTHCTCIFYFPLYAPLGPLVLTKREGWTFLSHSNQMPII